MSDSKELYNKFTEIIAISLHSQDCVEKIGTAPASVREANEMTGGSERRYRDDRCFRARVELMVAALMQALPDISKEDSCYFHSADDPLAQIHGKTKYYNLVEVNHELVKSLAYAIETADDWHDDAQGGPVNTPEMREAKKLIGMEV